MFAVIDVGSNSVRLMLSTGDKTLSKEVITTRLAEGITKTNMLSPEAVERTARAVSFFVEKAKTLDASDIFVFATAAVRQSKNGQVFVDRVMELCGIKVDVVAGEMEALLGLSGALGGSDGGVIDIGGASTEIIVSKLNNVVFCKSINIGAVRIKDECGQDLEKTSAFVNNKITEFGEIPSTFYYAIGGTATTIASTLQELEPYDPNKVDGFIVHKNQVYNLMNKLFSMSIEERKNLKGLQPSRAEIIAHGTTVLYSIMDKFNIDSVIVSEKDNLEGYLQYI